MRFLLDTHIILPLLDPSLKPPSLRLATLINDFSADCVCSAASLWEMAIKSRLGKLGLPCHEEDLPEACAMIGLNVIAVSATHAVTPVEPWPDTNDPFDRILLAICHVERLALLTVDTKLKGHPLVWRP
jgi:PIN domain nuclease of toxin-antitoxin system